MRLPSIPAPICSVQSTTTFQRFFNSINNRYSSISLGHINHVMLMFNSIPFPQDCFKAAWSSHKSVHVKAQLISIANSLSGDQNSDLVSQDIVEVIQGFVEDISLPEKVDVIISEWTGYFLLRESMFDSMICARDRWLKPTGVMYPSHARMWLATIKLNMADRKKNDLDGAMAVRREGSD
ncbi:unnamed protein product [Eruca vesicaria subsp. sativa]|uniref:Uncharacterized protein n=1 Tax=Eruca vesicaria subsp. sativa TaxID=29727 RepID=A0ABC8LTU6_ERUVS|nr:unnamed protein product [Eruca vesicaria subsp. sativa]